MQNADAQVRLKCPLKPKQLLQSVCTILKMYHTSVLKQFLRNTSYIDIALFVLSLDAAHATNLHIS